MTAVVLLMVAWLTCFLIGLLVLWSNVREHARISESLQSEILGLTAFNRLDRFVRWTPWGASIESARVQSRVNLSISQFVLAVIGFCLALGWVLGIMLSWLLFPVGIVLGALAVRGFIRKRIDQRREAFISQMPELARSLSNAASAGLSVRTALAITADDLDEPARTEVQFVSSQLDMGKSLDAAISSLDERMPSREVAMLTSSIIVASRSGGALVSALQDIAETLETTKELRREIKTTYSQTVATAYAVLGMGVGAVVLLDFANDGTVDSMLRSPLGQVALVVAGVAYATGIVIVRRMTKVDV